MGNLRPIGAVSAPGRAAQSAHADQAAVATSGAGSLDGADTIDKAVLLAKIQALEILVNRLRLDSVGRGEIKGGA